MINCQYENYKKIVEYLEEYTLLKKNNDYEYHDEVDSLIFSDKYEECEEDLITITRVIEDKYIHCLLEDINEEIYKFINLLNDLERLNLYSKQELLNILECYGDDEDEIVTVKNIVKKELKVGKNHD